MDFRHLIVTCLFSMLRLPFDNQKVKGNYAIFLKKMPDVFLKTPVRAPFTPPSESYRNPGLQITEIRISTDKSNYISDNKPYSTRKKAITPMIVQS